MWYRSLFVAPLMAVCLQAAALDSRDLRALQTDLARANDVWSLIQLEAWAEVSGQKLRSAVPGFSTFGNPVFGLPREVYRIYDCGDRVEVWSNARVYHWAPDGRPLSAATHFPSSPDDLDPSCTGAWFGACDFQTRIDAKGAPITGILHFFVVDSASNVAFARDVGGEVRENIGPLRVAEDGTAIAIACRGTNAAGEKVLPRMLVVTAGAAQTLAGWSKVEAVGPQGEWVVATNPAGQRMLHTKAGDVEIRACARGPNQTMVMTKDGLARIANNGSLEAIALPFVPGEFPELVGFPRWLVVASGSGTTSVSAFDLLGEPIDGGEPMPRTLACWRWSDLAANGVKSLPTATFEAPLSIDRGQSSALYQWAGKRIERIDFSADDLVVSEVAVAPADIQGVDYRFQTTVAELVDGRLVVVDGGGTEVWTGTVRELDVQLPDWGIAARGDEGKESWLGVRFARDPKDRREVNFELEPGPWEIAIHPSGRWAVAWRDDGTWRRIALPSGKVQESGVDDTTRPDPDGAPDPYGRFTYAGPRVFRKADGFPAAPGNDLNVIDAWRVGRSLLTLSAGGHVVISGRNANEILDLGWCRRGDHFALANGSLVIADSDNVVVGTLVPGPKLDNDPINRGKPTQDLPVGPWRAADLRFVPPRSGSLDWNREIGLVPDRIRNPDNEVLLVPLGSIVLAADATGARILGTSR